MSARGPGGPGAPGDAAPVVVVRGGTEPSAVDTARMRERVGVLRAAADALDAAADAGGLARVRLAAVDTADYRALAPVARVEGLPELAPWTPWPPHVAHARQRALDAADDVAAHARAAAHDLRSVGDRMDQAVRVYDDAELAAQGAVRELRSVARALGLPLTPSGVPRPLPLAPVLDVVAGGVLATLVAALRGEGLDVRRLVSSTAADHAPLVSWLSRWVGLASPGSGAPWRARGVGDAASALARLDLEGRAARYLPDPVTRRITTPDGVALPVAADADSALALVDALYDTERLPGSVIAVQRVDKGPDAPPAWVVAIPGTQLGQDRTVFSMTSNLALMDADPERRAGADSATAVLAAMQDAGVGPGEDVVLVGHSQGGMVAATVAASTVGTYAVRHVVTAGAPVAGHALPPGVAGTHVETQGEAISDLDGAENPATPARVTVTGTVDASAGGTSLVPHGVAHHRAVLAAAADVGDRGLDEHLADVETLLAGTPDDVRLYEARLVPRPDPYDRCLAPAPARLPTLPAPPGSPTWSAGP